MKLSIREEALFVIKTLQDKDFEAYLVGGAVRDIIIASKQDLDPSEAIKDYDFTTNATPAEIQQLFPESYYENEFGTVAITHEELLEQMGVEPTEAILPKPHQLPKNKIIDLANATNIHESLGTPEEIDQTEADTNWLPDFEITTYRSDEIYADFRRPDPAKLTWGKTIQEDLKRRDFTINAMALKHLKGDNFELIDPFQGIKDLELHSIKTVNEPSERFQEDALRMLRAVRFAVQLNFQIDEKTFEAVIKQAKLISKISWERISDEFLKIIASQYPAEGISLLDEAGLLQFILPELLEAKGVEQGGHHNTDVWTHSLDALQECPNPDPIVRLATLLHDVAKPRTFEIRDNKITFYNHEIVGSRMADKIAKRLKFSKNQRQRLFTLVRQHMFYYQTKNSDASIRRFMRNVSLENIDDILDLREADRLGSGARKTSWRLEEMKQRMIEQLNQPMQVTDLAINGHDLMTEFDKKPGSWLGEILGKLLEKVLDDPELNTKEKLMELAKEISSLE
jgi:tRNA nucleotidyltransferase (CCA-adding enzyme)